MSVPDQVAGELKLCYVECASVPPFAPRGTAFSGSLGTPSCQGKQPLTTLSAPYLKAELLALLMLETHPPALAL